MRLPTSQQRITIVGKTGSGKTVAGLWHLSNANYLSQPWVILDFKGEEQILAIDKAQYIDLKYQPKKPGIYVATGLEPDDENLEPFLRNIWRRGNTGVVVDEGYMMEELSAVKKRFRSLLTQGRSLHIPMIVLSQRPAWISRFALSEADFYQVFKLNDDQDIGRVSEFLPKGAYKKLPPYHSVYYDVGRDELEYLAPVPPMDDILETFEERLRPVRKVI